MCKCGLCFCVTGHEADYALTFGKDELVLEVCWYCFEDLTLLGFGANRVVRLEVIATYPDWAERNERLLQQLTDVLNRFVEPPSPKSPDRDVNYVA